MRIAIVDDHKEFRERLVRYIEANAANLEIPVDITCFADVIELVDRFQSSFDIIYLDVEMEFMVCCSCF